MQATFITSAQKANQCPDHNFPEIAMVGRSNCGKSSLINALLNRKNLAKESSTPGRTALINFFQLHIQKDEEWMLADLPGYGFSQAAKKQKADCRTASSTRIKDAGIMIRHLQDCRVQKKVGRGGHRGTPDTKSTSTLRI